MSTIRTTLLNHHLAVPPQIVPFAFDEEPTNYGESAAVQCMVSKGDLPIKIFWMHNNASIEELSDVNVIKTSSRISTLNIESVNAYHRGVFQCIASNLAGRTDYAAELRVNGKHLRDNRFFFLSFFFVPSDITKTQCRPLYHHSILVKSQLIWVKVLALRV